MPCSETTPFNISAPDKPQSIQAKVHTKITIICYCFTYYFRSHIQSKRAKKSKRVKVFYKNYTLILHFPTNPKYTQKNLHKINSFRCCCCCCCCLPWLCESLPDKKNLLLFFSENILAAKFTWLFSSVHSYATFIYKEKNKTCNFFSRKVKQKANKSSRRSRVVLLVASCPFLQLSHPINLHMGLTLYTQYTKALLFGMLPLTHTDSDTHTFPLGKKLLPVIVWKKRRKSLK